jgi:hypothetical protein
MLMPLPPPPQVLDKINEIMTDHKMMLRGMTHALRDAVASLDETKELALLLYDAASLAPEEHFAENVSERYIDPGTPVLPQRWTTFSPVSSLSGSSISSISSVIKQSEEPLPTQSRRASREMIVDPKDTLARKSTARTNSGSTESLGEFDKSESWDFPKDTSLKNGSCSLRCFQMSLRLNDREN